MLCFGGISIYYFRLFTKSKTQYVNIYLSDWEVNGGANICHCIFVSYAIWSISRVPFPLQYIDYGIMFVWSKACLWVNIYKIKKFYFKCLLFLFIRPQYKVQSRKMCHVCYSVNEVFVSFYCLLCTCSITLTLLQINSDYRHTTNCSYSLHYFHKIIEVRLWNYSFNKVESLSSLRTFAFTN